MSSLQNYLNKSLETIKKANWYRYEKTISGLSGSLVEIERNWLVNFASNDYLGLASDKRVITGALEAIQKYGTGSTGSRLLTGHRPLHHQLEEALAQWKGTENALVFSSGYQANIGTISALVGKKDLILGDEYNHSSLKNGGKLSQAHCIDYAHSNCRDLVNLLTQHRHNFRHCLITTDTVFSMDGDIAPLTPLLDIANYFDCWLLVDEAHATGVLGVTGAGCVEHFQMKGDNLIQIGTLSKAIGSLGGYVTGSNLLMEFLRNRCPTWIYTTALSPGDTGAALTAVEIIPSALPLRQQLWDNINHFKKLAKMHHIDFMDSDSAILCLKTPDAETALGLAQKLNSAGFFVPAIRPPTVPSSRLRFSLMANHTQEDLTSLMKVISGDK